MTEAAQLLLVVRRREDGLYEVAGDGPEGEDMPLCMDGSRVEALIGWFDALQDILDDGDPNWQSPLLSRMARLATEGGEIRVRLEDS